MAKHFFVILAVLLVIGSWLFYEKRAGNSPEPVLFGNMATQEKSASQRRNGGVGELLKTPPKTVAAAMVDSVGEAAGEEPVYFQNGSSYLTSGRQYSSYGNTLPAELGGIAGYQKAMERGREVYQIHCTVCHGEKADGKGIMSTYPEYPEIPSLSDDKYKAYPLGQLFKSVAEGQGNMPAFKKKLTVRDLWSVGTYVKALQEGKEVSPHE